MLRPPDPSLRITPRPPPARAMEEYVEDADAKRLAAASRAAELEQALAGVRRGEEDSYSQVGGPGRAGGAERVEWAGREV